MAYNKNKSPELSKNMQFDSVADIYMVKKLQFWNSVACNINEIFITALQTIYIKAYKLK